MVVLYNIKNKFNKILDFNYGKFILFLFLRMVWSVFIEVDFYF